jgi:nucleoside-diphosphate-sugar epimerase
MKILILGGTAWLGREIAGQAMAAGHDVTCLARGASGSVPEGATLVVADRLDPDAYAEVLTDWDSVVEVSWQPGFVRAALSALADRARHWTYVSSISVYSSDDAARDESAGLLPTTDLLAVTREQYGEAKVACEISSGQQVGDRLLIARAGLIGGPGDHTGRTGYWVARAARDRQAPMLVPDSPEQSTQVVDARDLAGWLLAASHAGTVGTFDAVGPSITLAEWIASSRQVGGHTGPTIPAAPAWLLEHGVSPWAGRDSLPLWIPGPDHLTRSGAAATAAGLRHQPRVDLLTDLLDWERDQGLDRDRPAGLTARREQELLAALGS